MQEKTFAPINLNWMSIASILLAVWVVIALLLAYRLQTLGAFASLSTIKSMQYIKAHAHADPGSVRLEQPYEQWALALNLTDPSDNLKVALGFADGQGISMKNISPTDPNNHTYSKYYYQGPGTPFIIAICMKVFGRQTVLPYFVFVCTIYFLTTLLACVLASRFFTNKNRILMVGLLSLICFPALDYDFAIGIFSSEPLTAPFIVSSLIALSNFWQALKRRHSIKSISISAFFFSLVIAGASYFRDIYTTFAYFCFVILFIYALFNRGKFKSILSFVLIASITLFCLQLPWKMRNYKLFGEYAMTGSTYYAYGMWLSMWQDYKQSADWCWNGGLGLGNYLAPEKSATVIAKLNTDKASGSRYAFRSLIEAISKKPLQAMRFKLSVYDTLWLGQRRNIFIYLWCLSSTLFFIIFLKMKRFRFIPALYLFPAFLFCLSPLIHFEHRYSQPFFLFITPIAITYVLNRYLSTAQFQRLAKLIRHS